MATALRTYHDQRLANARLLAEEAEAGVNAAQAAVDAARAEQAAAVARAAGLDAAIASIRASLADPGQSPADLEALAGRLRAAQIERRGVSAELARIGAGLAAAEGDRGRVRGLLSVRRTVVTEAGSAGKGAAEAAAVHAVWLAAETAEAVGALVAECRTLLSDIGETPDPTSDPESDLAARRALIVAARDRIAADIPKVLRDHARARQARDFAGVRAAYAAQAAAEEDARAAFLADRLGPAGAVAPAELAYARATAAFRAAAVGAAADHAAALGLLAKIPASPPPTPAQLARIAEVALEADDEALATEAALDDVLAQIRDATLVEERAVAAARLADPLADPGADADVQAARAALAALETPLADAQAAHTAEHALALDLWELAVPDSAWANLAAFDTAVEHLSRVAGLNLAGLRTAFLAAEDALVAALAAADQPPSRRALADDAVAAARDRRDRAADSAAADRLSVLRGDRRREVVS